MAKKRRSTAPPAPTPALRGVDPRDARVAPIETWQDVPDDEDAFHISRDKVLLEAFDDRGGSGGDFSASDEEIMPLSPSPSSSSSSSSEGGEEEEEQEEGWGASKKSYYATDQEAQEVDATEEQSEALRLQSKHLSALTPEDFTFDPKGWHHTPTSTPTTSTAIVEHLLKTPRKDMTEGDRLKLLHLHHPEFPHLAREFALLEPAHAVLSRSAAAAEAVGETARSSVSVVKFRALSAYLGVLSIYFAVLTAPSGGGGVEGVKEHGVMEGIVKCRAMWESVKGLEVEELSSRVGKKAAIAAKRRKLTTTTTTTTTRTNTTTIQEPKPTTQETNPTTTTTTTPNPKPQPDDLSHLLLLPHHTQPQPQKPKQKNPTDFQEDHHLPPQHSSEKSSHRRNLRFYTSQITTKASSRKAAAQLAGGDADLPRADARKVRKRHAAVGQELDGREPTSGASFVGRLVEDRGDDDEYVRLLARGGGARKAERKALYEASKPTTVADQVDGQAGKRAIGYTIAKNKGLTPHRKKEVRNPRVKKRVRYEAAKKKLASQKAVFKGGLKGVYGGETTGIKSNLVKSVKFA